MKLHFGRYVILNIIWITGCSICLFFSDQLPLELSSPDMQSLLFFLACFSLPISIIWTVNKVFQPRSNAFTVIAVFLSISILFFTFFGRSICKTTDEILYTNKYNTSIIVARSFDCGAWDSDLPNYSYYKKTPVAGAFYWTTKADTSQLDHSIWIKWQKK
jgi:hypothetical protein